MSNLAFEKLIEVARNVHESHPKVSEFCSFPDDLKSQNITHNHINSSKLLQNEKHLFTDRYHDFRDAFINAAPIAHWRETYKNTDINRDFMDRFGCYCLIGADAPFHSNKMHAFVVYMPKDLYYP